VSNANDISLPETLNTIKVSRLTDEQPHHEPTSHTDVVVTPAAPTISNTDSNFHELTTEKLSLTDKSNRFPSESLLTSSLTSTTLNVTSGNNITTMPSSAIADSVLLNSNNSTNVHYKGSKIQQRVNSNSLVKSSNGGMRVSGQKIEMPQLNNFFDHSAYLKKHEHGFR
jgi:hypothetical protein